MPVDKRAKLLDMRAGRLRSGTHEVARDLRIYHHSTQVRIDRQGQDLDQDPAIDGHIVQVNRLGLVVYDMLPRDRVLCVPMPMCRSDLI